MIAIEKYNDKYLCEYFEDGKVIDIHVEDIYSEDKINIGDIYIGKVKNVLKNINAAFVEFYNGEMGYLPLEEAAYLIYTQRKAENRLPVQGDEILVQVRKAAKKNKLVTLSAIIEITGKFSVIRLGEKGYFVSSKIKDIAVRKEIEDVLEKYSGDFSGNYISPFNEKYKNLLSPDLKIIARTNSKYNINGLEEEINNSLKLMENIIVRAFSLTVFSCIRKNNNCFSRFINKYDEDKIENIFTDCPEVIEFLNESEGINKNDKIEFWDEEKRGRMDTVLRMSHALEEALNKKVWLKSGGYLFIEHTEALSTIDVNTGKNLSKVSKSGNILKTNKEAAIEAMRQIRLRNISGIIIIDFIDMADKADRDYIFDLLKQKAREDILQCEIVDITALGLFEVTRKREGTMLLESIG
ncbi:MAG: ribonuclease E/G [Lachnospiraceae bacterium]|nr:ribonuclease E/G [Lachnospiraceae bacterium]